jgi:hypothetical protein
MSAKSKDGGPAFPHAGFLSPLEGNTALQFDSLPQSGMSLRDWFAGQSLAAIPLKDDGKRVSGKDHTLEVMLVATAAYRYADAMLAARKEITK